VPAIETIERLLQSAHGGDPELTALAGWVLERKLGSGGMGEVFLLRQIAGAERCAIKILRPEDSFSGALRREFGREIANMLSLAHPNIVRMRDYVYSSAIFFTMEYCDGGSVIDLLRQAGGRLPVEQAKRIILHALKGLEYAHSAEIPYVLLADGRIVSSKGMVHRDIKPHNILLSNEGGEQVAKIADFGLSKAYQLAGQSGFTITGQRGGSFPFMPRQLILNFKYAQPDVDVWSMAASLYYMLTGSSPRDFSKEPKNPERVILKSKPVPIQLREPSIPGPLARVIDAALIDEPQITFQSATEFREALNRC
jgi:serine/threonine protein kinase